MLQVVEIVVEACQHLFKCVGITIIECCKGGDAGAYLIEVTIALVSLHYLLYEIFALRSRSDERHISLKDIHKLRKLVKMMSSQEFTDLCQSLVFAGRGVEQLWPIFLRIHAHRPEFQYVEFLTLVADALLPIDRRPSIFSLYGYVTRYVERRKNYYQYPGKQEIERSLDKAFYLVHPVFYFRAVVDRRHFIFF